MNRLSLLALTGTLALLSACGSSAAAGGGGTASPSDAASTADTGSGAGNNTKNTTAISTKSDTNAAAEMKVDKPATATDATKATGAKMGAANAGKILNLYLSDAAGNILTIIIDTAQHPLPKTGIKLGAVNTGAWATYVGMMGGMPAVLNSTESSTGTLDITACPDKSGVATVGVLHDVVLEAPDMGTAMAGMKSMTLNGSFNLVYFGAPGELMCTVAPPATADAGSTGTDAGSTGGTSCTFGECDNHSNTTRNCCPYGACLSTCYAECAQKAGTCAMDCSMGGGDPAACPAQCAAAIVVCFEGCWTSCNVSADCKTKLQALDACGKKNEGGCGGDQSCIDQKCCAEAKAAF